MARRHSSDGLSGEEVTVNELFRQGDRRLRAPEFQRHYVWRPEQEVEEFWRDLSAIREEGTIGDQEDSLFLGAVVLQVIEVDPHLKSPSLFSIIDGQQRIITLYLTLAAIAEAFYDAGLPKECDDIIGEFLLVRSGEHTGEPRVETTASDTNQFRTILQHLKRDTPEPYSSEVTGANRNLTNAWEAIRKRVRETGSNDEGTLEAEHLRTLRDTVLGRIELVEVVLGTRHDPHQVYERLNIGGVRLASIDLIRNLVFLTAGADSNAAQRIYRDYWDPFERDLADESYRAGYFFPYALIRQPSTTKASVYRSLSTFWTSEVTNGSHGEKAAADIMSNLREYVPAYRAIVGKPFVDLDGHPTGIDAKAWNAIQRLKRMGATQTMYPYLMQLVHHHMQGPVTAEEVARVISIIDSFIIRRAFAGMGNTGIHAIFKDVWNHAKADHLELVQRLDVRTVTFPDDESFADAIKTFKLYSSNRCRYVLTEYERSYDTGDPSEWDPEEVTADHLMPQSPRQGEWDGVSDEDREALGDTWANLVPLTGSGNATKSAASWADAHRLMIDEHGTVFKSTRAVFQEYETWNAEMIQDRADKLVTWALQRWPKPIV